MTPASLYFSIIAIGHFVLAATKDDQSTYRAIFIAMAYASAIAASYFQQKYK